MQRKFKFCIRCRRTIVENELQRGLFVQTPNGMLCATCAQQLDEETEASKLFAAGTARVRAEAKESSSAEPAAAAPARRSPPGAGGSAKGEPAPRPSPMAQVSTREEAAGLSPDKPAGAPVPIASDPPEPPGKPAGPQRGVPEPPAQLLEGIRERLEAIHRTLLFEKSSPWNVLATIAQCLAIGMLILAAFNWADNPSHLLLVSLVFQVMALTFFVRAR
jgi:hypothetical protein